MVQFLLDNSVVLIGLLAFAALSYSALQAELKEKNLKIMPYAATLEQGLSAEIRPLFLKALAAITITLIISMVSFRELWGNDVFHIVFLTMLLGRPVAAGLKRISDRP